MEESSSLLIAWFLVAGCSSERPTNPPASLPCCAFVELTNFSRFTHEAQSAGSEALLSPIIAAYAGQFAGMKAYVRRFNDLAEIEPWIKARVPIILSISSDALHGRALDRNNGHLVVCAGFTPDGNVVICNPWADLAAGQQVKRIYNRARVVRAWASSRNTAYVIYPKPTSLRN